MADENTNTEPAGWKPLQLEEAAAGSISLCSASAMLEVMIDRFQSHADELCRVFGNARHTDANVLRAIQDQVDEAKRIFDRE